jgi:L-lactate utilization protein LutC
MAKLPTLKEKEEMEEKIRQLEEELAWEKKATLEERIERIITKYMQDNLSDLLRKEKYIIEDISEDYLSRKYDLTTTRNYD